MANEEHLAILKKGVEAWNQWRRFNFLVKPDLVGSDLRGALLPEINLSGANLQRANLAGADLSKADLWSVNFEVANLERANLQAGTLVRGNLKGTNFRATNLQAAILQESNLRAANLQWANLQWANLQGCNLDRAVVGGTIFADVNLRSAQGLDTIEHIRPSTIGIDTLYASGGDIPESFLRGCGVPDSMIGHARALVAAEHPIDYYSVFISYSSHDEAVAQRLHADLQAHGVRCWFAPHDLEIGVPIVHGIDEAIRIADKLLIILSAAAVTSRWVEFEVSTTLHREVEEGRIMLFPIRIDDTVLHTPKGWAAQLRSRHIGDFRGWKDHDRYQVAFNRLLRDLKAKEQTRST